MILFFFGGGGVRRNMNWRKKPKVLFPEPFSKINLRLMEFLREFPFLFPHCLSIFIPKKFSPTKRSPLKSFSGYPPPSPPLFLWRKKWPGGKNFNELWDSFHPWAEDPQNWKSQLWQTALSAHRVVQVEGFFCTQISRVMGVLVRVCAWGRRGKKIPSSTTLVSAHPFFFLAF